ncbi:MAG: radical SAM protein [Anaerolineales bacterium]|jgi:radical SAM protein with 4Fe4S-binding SPASM domain
MTNICVSDVCDLACPFCFAGSYLHRKRNGRPAFITLDEYQIRLDFVQRNGMDTARLIGGEPTLHPKFDRLLTLARERDLKINVFSHGLIREKPLRALLGQPPRLCNVLVNMNATGGAALPTVQEQKRRAAILAQLGPRAKLGYTIWRADFDLWPLFDLVKITGCDRSIRLGLAQPMASSESRYLHPQRYAFIGRRIAQFSREAAAQNIKLSFDCGFVPCMFDQEARDLLTESGTDVAWHCSPILDIGLEGQAIHCFPLSEQVQTTFDLGRSRDEISDHLRRQAERYRPLGLFRRCRECRYRKEGICAGGCLAHTVRRMHREAVRISYQQVV